MRRGSIINSCMLPADQHASDFGCSNPTGPVGSGWTFARGRNALAGYFHSAVLAVAVLAGLAGWDVQAQAASAATPAASAEVEKWFAQVNEAQQ